MDVTGIGNNMISGVTQNAQNAANKAADDEFKQRLQAAMDSKDDAALKKVSKDLEAVFVNMVFEKMRNTIDTSGESTEAAPGKDIYQSMFDQNVADSLSKGKGIGIADMIYKQVMQEMQNRYTIDEKK